MSEQSPRKTTGRALPARVTGARLLRDTVQPFLRLRTWTGKLVTPVSLPVIRPEATAALKAMAAQLRQAMPANWEGVDEDWDAAIEIMNSQGIPLIWIPRGSIVGALMDAAGTAERHAILIDARHEIVADCLAVLARVTAPGPVPLAGLAADAARALDEGHFAASQALSANVFDTWLRDVVFRQVLFEPPRKREGFYPAIRRQIVALSGETMLTEFKSTGSLTPVLMAIQSFKPGGPVPAQLNRHATAHAAGPEQYSDVNAVIALMLTTSVLGQAQESGW